jgi:antirestriction protein ArdC
MDPARFGSHDYSKEELVAEMTAAYLCGHCAIDTATLDNTAAYIDSWLGVLRGDSRLVVHAAAQAQKAADWILGRTVASDE